jgi:hypothetical protein
VSSLMYLAVWSRAVIAPAWRRAVAVWVGAGIAGGIIFGPTGMRPHELTRFALGVPAVGALLAITWVLVFVPTARLLVRADTAGYLRSLPGPRGSPVVVGAIALVGLQLPWLALWVVGDGARGLAIVLGLTVLIVGIALWRPRVRRARWPRWSHGRQALRGVYMRALRRRASDALIRGVGLAILGGLVAALVVRNNVLSGRDAAVLGCAVIQILLVPAAAGALLPLFDAHRQSGWLASSLGISPASRVIALATVVAGVYIAGALVAIGGTGVALGWVLDGAASLTPESGAAVVVDASTISASPYATLAWIAATTLATSVAASMIATRALIRTSAGRNATDGSEHGGRDASTARDGRDDRDERGAAVRVVVGAIVAAALAVLCIGWLGLAGVGAIGAIGICSLITARPT